MNILMIFILIVVGAIFIWQLALLVRDIIRKVKNKKKKDTDANIQADDSAKKGEQDDKYSY